MHRAIVNANETMFVADKNVNLIGFRGFFD
jgi:hypothetical protein